MFFQIKPLEAGIATADFQCGSEPLNEYIRRYASQDVRRNVARVFVAAPESDTGRLAGYFTLSAGSVNCTSLPGSLAKKLPRYPVPVALIGRLAVDLKFQGKGLGSILLADACQKVRQASAVLAVAGIIVDAKDAQATAFYKHFGFVSLSGQTDKMMLPASVFQSK
ncbi:MAG TPA: GNAT family N-acetyltransferase [Gallionella sp.]|nr:GNAT family N-acetyltransferase [Gallionella sp.]